MKTGIWIVGALFCALSAALLQNWLACAFAASWCIAEIQRSLRR